jgi:hypothetical protein
MVPRLIGAPRGFVPASCPLGDIVHLSIEEISRLGEPLLLKANAKAFTNQCRVVVRENIPITVRYWNNPKADGVNFVSNSKKEEL